MISVVVCAHYSLNGLGAVFVGFQYITYEF
jgi:hypothetical protein